MGCCQNRDQSGCENEFMKYSKFEYESLSNTTEEKDFEKPLVDHIKLCRKEHNWKGIYAHIMNKNPAPDTKSSPNWTAYPKTIGCIALTELSKVSRKYPEQVISCFKEHMSDITEIMSTSTSDKIEQCVLLINKLVAVDDEDFKQSLVSIGFFDTIVPYLLSSKYEFRHASAVTCARIYKGNVSRQHHFIKADGLSRLMQSINLSPMRGILFGELLQCIIDAVLVTYK
jgi:hypothetical protein